MKVIIIQVFPRSDRDQTITFKYNAQRIPQVGESLIVKNGNMTKEIILRRMSTTIVLNSNKKVVDEYYSFYWWE